MIVLPFERLSDIADEFGEMSKTSVLRWVLSKSEITLRAELDRLDQALAKDPDDSDFKFGLWLRKNVARALDRFEKPLNSKAEGPPSRALPSVHALLEEAADLISIFVSDARRAMDPENFEVAFERELTFLKDFSELVRGDA